MALVGPNEFKVRSTATLSHAQWPKLARTEANNVQSASFPAFKKYRQRREHDEVGHKRMNRERWYTVEQ